MVRGMLPSLLGALGLAGLIAGCGASLGARGLPSAGSPAAGHAKFVVVAGESFWGSIAAQLAGDRADVRSIIVNPGTDPHSYQLTAHDARTIAGAQLAIVNGIGYDTWMTEALAADRGGGGTILTVGDLLGLRPGENPHQWYSPSSVREVVDRIAADYAKLDPADAGYFAQRRQSLESRGLAEYDRLRREIRARYSGVPVGYSESIFAPLGEDLGLTLLTPSSFAKAIAEGTEVTAQDQQAVDHQAQNRQIKVWVYNSQNATPEVQRVNEIAQARRIPIATITETLSPASDSFQQWQVTQLGGLIAALHEATGR